MFFVTVIVSEWNMFCGSVQPIVTIEVHVFINSLSKILSYGNDFHLMSAFEKLGICLIRVFGNVMVI